MCPVDLISNSLRYRNMPTMLRFRYDKKLLNALLGLTGIFRMVSDVEHVVHALLNPAHGAPLDSASAEDCLRLKNRPRATPPSLSHWLFEPKGEFVSSFYGRHSVTPIATGFLQNSAHREQFLRLMFRTRLWPRTAYLFHRCLPHVSFGASWAPTKISPVLRLVRPAQQPLADPG
jgi:hypothetical protein